MQNFIFFSDVDQKTHKVTTSIERNIDKNKILKMNSDLENKTLTDQSNRVSEVKKPKKSKEINYEQLLQEIKAETAELILKNVRNNKKTLIFSIFLERKKSIKN